VKPNLIYQDTLKVPAATLGEGIHYLPSTQKLYWTDIKTPRLFEYDTIERRLNVQPFSEPICWVNHTPPEQLIVGCASGIYEYNPVTQDKREIWHNQELAKNIRLNDAKTDRMGNLYFGTMDDKEQESSGSLFRLLGYGMAGRIDDGYVISNGPAFSVSGKTLYSVSSAAKVIYAFDVEPNGQLSNKREFIHFPPQYGTPDGITVDAEDNIWIACWGGYAVLCYSSKGTLLTAIDIPAPYVTNIIFAGPDLKDVYITSALHNMTAQALKKYPYAGRVFHFRSEIAGIAETPMAPIK